MTRRIIIPGDPRTKKNHTQIVKNRYSGKIKVIQSEAYIQYEENCGWYLNNVEPFLSPCNLKCEYYMRTKRKVDLSNLIAATSDILVRYGILIDDNSEIIKGYDGSRVYYSKENPRVEITITEFKEVKE